MTKKIKNHLRSNPSYFKWGVLKLASKFGCSPRTMTRVINELSDVKHNYLTGLKG